MRSSVVVPAPLLPYKPKTLPFRTVIEMPSSARVAWRIFGLEIFAISFPWTAGYVISLSQLARKGKEAKMTRSCRVWTEESPRQPSCN